MFAPLSEPVSHSISAVRRCVRKFLANCWKPVTPALHEVADEADRVAR